MYVVAGSWRTYIYTCVYIYMFACVVATREGVYRVAKMHRLPSVAGHFLQKIH